jgi:hypothetical protein
MANEIQEFFLGQNEQEIENERRRKRALIHYLPNLMGDTDQTKYILRKDGNQNQNESLGSNAIDKPGKVVISNGGEKSHFIDQSFSNGQIDVNKFSKEIIRYINDFQERYKSVPKYKSIDKNYYNYNWKIFFDILGIPNK